MEKQRDRWLVFSDLHAHPHKRYSRTNRSGQNSRLEVSLKVLRSILDYASTEGIFRVVFAGDLFETYGRVSVDALNAVYREFSLWSMYGMEVLMVPGNHDFAERSGRVHSIDIFRQLSGFTIVDVPSVIEWGGQKICCVPYREELDPGWFVEADILLAHGCVEKLCSVPVLFPDDPMKSFGEWLRLAWVEKYRLSVVGHVHDPVAMRTTRGVVLVPGCPYQDNPHGKEEHRGFWEVAIGSEGFVSYRLIEPDSPRFFRILIERDGEVPEIEPEDSLVRDGVWGNIVQVLPGPLVSASFLLELKKKLYEKGAEYVELCSPVVEAGVGPGFAPRMEMSVFDAPVAVLEKALSSGLIDLRGESLETLLFLGLQVLEEANGVLGQR